MSAPGSGSTRLQHTQAQVGEIVDTMRVNVNKVLERDEKLWELDNRADALQAGASQFETGGGKLKRTSWWRNCKTMGFLIGFVLIVCISIVVWNFS